VSAFIEIMTGHSNLHRVILPASGYAGARGWLMGKGSNREFQNPAGNAFSSPHNLREA
jgi:hypothetical protein